MAYRGNVLCLTSQFSFVVKKWQTIFISHAEDLFFVDKGVDYTSILNHNYSELTLNLNFI